MSTRITPRLITRTPFFAQPVTAQLALEPLHIKIFHDSQEFLVKNIVRERERQRERERERENKLGQNK